MEFSLKGFETVVSVTRLANIHYFEFNEQYHTANDRHAFRELVYVDNGEIYVNAENYSGELKKNEIIIHKSLELHSIYCNAPTPPNVIIIGFESDCAELDSFSEQPHSLTHELVIQLTEVIKEGRTVFLPPYDVPNLKNMRKRSDYPFGADQMIRLKLELFLINLIRDKTEELGKNLSDAEPEKIIKELHAYIDANYSKSINLDELCFLFNTNKTSICNRFREHYGTTVIDYVNRKRIKEAKKLLKSGQLSITQISYNLGYNSVHYFSRIFKKYEKISPTQYAAKNNKKFEL